MSGTQRLSNDHFVQFEKDLGEVSHGLSTNLRTLINALETVQAAWTGDGANAFTRAQTSLNRDHEALRSLIVNIHEAVELTHRSGGANDGEIAAELRKIDVNGAEAGGKLGTAADGLDHHPKSKLDNF